MREPAHSDRDVTIERARESAGESGVERRVRTSMDVALDALGGKWKLTIIVMLAAAPRRTGELRKAIPAVSQRMLIAQLRELQRDGLVARTSYNEVPPRVVYRLTRYGRSALPVVRLLSRWGTRHAEQIFPRQGVEYRMEELGCR